MPDASASASAFEQIKHTDEQAEYWSARELSKLLGYDKWRNLLGVVHEAMEVCQVQGGSAEGVFVAISRNPTKKGGRPSREYAYRLTRHACYLVAESADGRKAEE